MYSCFIARDELISVHLMSEFTFSDSLLYNSHAIKIIRNNSVYMFYMSLERSAYLKSVLVSFMLNWVTKYSDFLPWFKSLVCVCVCWFVYPATDWQPVQVLICLPPWHKIGLSSSNACWWMDGCSDVLAICVQVPCRSSVSASDRCHVCGVSMCPVIIEKLGSAPAPPPNTLLYTHNCN